MLNKKANNILAGKKILIFQQRGWGKGIGRVLAARLYKEGCRLAALTIKKTTHELIVNQKNAQYDLIINHDEIMGNPQKYLGDDNYSLTEICEELGIDSIWPLVATERLLVRSYKDKYYYSYKQNLTDEEIKTYVKAIYKYVKIFFDQFNPDLIIAPNFVALQHIMISLYAKKRGTKMIALTYSKIQGMYFFSYNYQYSEGKFYYWLKKLNEGEVETDNRDKAKEYIRGFREKFKAPDYINSSENKRVSFFSKIKQEILPYKSILRWYIKGPSPDDLGIIGPTIDYRPPQIILRDHYSRKRYKKFMDQLKYFPFERVEKYIYFPLQVQPEAMLDVMAPYFNNQIEICRLIAMSLPDDYKLIVKEHPAMVGMRPPSYIKKIIRTPNVKLIDYRIPNEHVLKGADLIISPNSTAIAEAAFLNKPVIQFGNLGMTLILPNVYKHTDMTTLSKKIKEVLKIDLNNKEYERKLENYIAAVFDKGFNFEYIQAWEKGGGDMEKLWNIYKKEIFEIFSNN